MEKTQSILEETRVRVVSKKSEAMGLEVEVARVTSELGAKTKDLEATQVMLEDTQKSKAEAMRRHGENWAK